MSAPLLHIATSAQWRSAMDIGAVRPEPDPFLHLSTPEQVALLPPGSTPGAPTWYCCASIPTGCPRRSDGSRAFPAILIR